jgi:AcrR family transcriptional regulator
MSFKKRGRPPEDRPARRQEIYTAVRPLLHAYGVRGLSMRDAAQAACLSVGALYYYFPTKRELVLYGLQPETIQRHCHAFHREWGTVAAVDPPRYFAAFVDSLNDGLLAIQPAMRAAIELGAVEMQLSLDAIRAGMTGAESELGGALRLAAPDLGEAEFQALLNAIRRMFLGAVVDAAITVEEFRSDLEALLQRYLRGSTGRTQIPVSAAATG